MGTVAMQRNARITSGSERIGSGCVAPTAAAEHRMEAAACSLLCSPSQRVDMQRSSNRSAKVGVRCWHKDQAADAERGVQPIASASSGVAPTTHSSRSGDASSSSWLWPGRNQTSEPDVTSAV